MLVRGDCGGCHAHLNSALLGYGFEMHVELRGARDLGAASCFRILLVRNNSRRLGAKAGSSQSFRETPSKGSLGVLERGIWLCVFRALETFNPPSENGVGWCWMVLDMDTEKMRRGKWSPLAHRNGCIAEQQRVIPFFLMWVKQRDILGIFSSGSFPAFLNLMCLLFGPVMECGCSTFIDSRALAAVVNVCDSFSARVSCTMIAHPPLTSQICRPSSS